MGVEDQHPIPLLMSEPSATCGVVRPLWVFPNSEEYILYHVDDDALEQMVAYVHTETRVDEYGRKLAPYYDSINRFLHDSRIRIHRAHIIEELHKNPELLPAIASIFAARETLQRKQRPSALGNKP